MTNRSHLAQPFISAAILIGMALLWILFAPTQFGGQASYVIIAGASMEPSLRWGDLVIAHQSDTYEVGDVVTYTHPRVGPVIHRIIGVDGAKYILQGDNNEWVDSYQPGNEEILGESWLTLRGAADFVQELRSPLGLALLSISIGIMVLVTFSRHQTQHDKQKNPLKSGKLLAPSSAALDLREGWIFFLAVILLGGILLSAFAFSRPMWETIILELPYQHHGEFSYSAKSSPSVYDQGLIRSGDAIFHSIVDDFIIRYTYEFEGPNTTDFSGAYNLILELSEPNGWRRRIELLPVTTFNETPLSISRSINISQIIWLVDHLRSRTDFDRLAFDVRIIPIINIHTKAAGQIIQDEFAPALHFKLDDYQLYLDGVNPFEEIEDPLNPVQIGMLEHLQTVPATLNILGLDIQVEMARWIAGIAVAVSLLSLVVIFYPVMRRWQQGESDRISLQYNQILLDVDKLPKAKPTQTIDLTKFSDLAKIAQSIDTLILHQAKQDAHTYLLQSGETTYRFLLQDEPAEEDA
jgi:signal peptidase I